MKQGTVWSHGPIVRPHVSLVAFRDVFCQYSCDRPVSPSDRTGAKSKLHSLLTMRPHRVPRDRTPNVALVWCGGWVTFGLGRKRGPNVTDGGLGEASGAWVNIGRVYRNSKLIQSQDQLNVWPWLHQGSKRDLVLILGGLAAS
ncbi:hypothetical protein PIB30_073552 [Stylosanthes scabra]|uniref:Uncharacterized protein n=1 Tax=Stylosanthes scabra TaxID=79078 RepID=A0ABU6YM02_9FABA|nr:hypothetical protein [Stylosanthes scabra]